MHHQFQFISRPGASENIRWRDRRGALRRDTHILGGGAPGGLHERLLGMPVRTGRHIEMSIFVGEYPRHSHSSFSLFESLGP